MRAPLQHPSSTFASPTRVDRLVAALMGSLGSDRLRWRILNRYLKTAKNHEDRLSARYRSSIQNHRMRARGKALSNMLFASFDVRLLALEKANRRAPRGVKLGPLQLIRKAKQLNMFRPSEEAVPLQIIDKPTGGTRQIMKPRTEQRARQHILKQVMSPIFNPHACQYSANGSRGRSAAIAEVEANLLAGFHHTFQLDIRDAYPSCPPDCVRRMLGPTGLSWRIVENNILARHMNLQVIPNHRDVDFSIAETQRGRRGLPQGFSSSARVFHMIVANAIRSATFPSDVRILNYADDFLIMARTQRAVFEGHNTLVRAIMRVIGGYVGFKDRYRLASWGFEFLKYRIKKQHSYIRIDIRPEHERNFGKKLATKLCRSLQCGEHHARRMVLKALQRHVDSHEAQKDAVRRTIIRATFVHSALIKRATKAGYTDVLRQLQRINMGDFLPVLLPGPIQRVANRLWSGRADEDPNRPGRPRYDLSALPTNHL